MWITTFKVAVQLGLPKLCIYTENLLLSNCLKCFLVENLMCSSCLRKETCVLCNSHRYLWEVFFLSIIVVLAKVLHFVYLVGIVQDENPCSYYMRTGACKFGIGCKFHHPQPDSAVPVTGPASHGSTASWSSPKSTYISAPRSGPQTYMPVIYPPSQGMVSAPEWNTYMVSKSYLYWLLTG